MTLNRTPIVTHHRMCALGTTLLWKHMGRLMNERKTFSFPMGKVSNSFMTKDKKHIVVNGRRLYDIDKDNIIKLPNCTYKVGDAMIEYNEEMNETYIYTHEFEYVHKGHAHPNMNKISFGYDKHFYDTMDIVYEYAYDPKIDMYINTYIDGFSITRRLGMTPAEIISGMDRGTLTDSCYFQCDSQLFAFSDTMRFVAYIYKKTLYIGETTYPFRLYTSERLNMDDIVSISMTGLSPIVTHDDKVTVFNYLRN